MPAGSTKLVGAEQIMADETIRGILLDSSIRGVGGLRLAVIHAGKLSFFEVPDHGAVVVGRGKSADVRIEDGRISREHVRLHFGDSVEIEDLGSVNGTLLQNRPIPAFTRVPLAPTEAVSIGGAVVMVQPDDMPQEPATSTLPPPDQASVTSPGAGIVLEDEQMKRLYEMAGRIALSNLNVLILGETGTGKELLAETIHRRSTRADKTFLCLNCATISETLLDSELFGHVRGAFTGAHQNKPGLLESAPGGTVFLDELGEMSPATQAKLLRVLETRQVMRVGSSQPRSIDVRFVSATNADLQEEIARGRFRRDLYFRLNTVALQLPPLRERRQELLPLARHFIEVECRASGRSSLPTLGPAALKALQQHDFPGNVRELRSAVQRAVALGEQVILPEHLALGEAERPRGAAAVQVALPSSAPAASTPPREASENTPTGGAQEFRAELAELEKRRILEALDAFAGNQTRAAEHLGISRRTLLKRLDDYGANRPRKRQPPEA